MRKTMSFGILSALALVLVLVVFMAGCKNDEATPVSVCATCSPLASTITPGCSSTGVPLNQKINATFSGAMD
ncbi:MAG TPA: hypothetical protein VI704_08205, partial [Bacteroidota bacterium]|nr:hypothetical protein [Bacteroidota bacterium]